LTCCSLQSATSFTAATGKTFSFVVAGSGPELKAITQAAEEMKVANYVTFTGRIPDERLFTM
jgi:hypothetical protein